MVRNQWLLILMLSVLCITPAMAEVRMAAKVDKKTLALGEPLTLELNVEDVSDAISNINLDKLKQHFNVYGISSVAQKHSKKGRTVISETMTLTLYPLHSGRLQIPALTYKGARSKELQVSVLEFSKLLPRVTFKTVVDISHPLVRQEITLMLDIYDDGTLQWTVPREIVATGFHQRRLAESQREEMLDGTRYTVHHYAWALLPLQEGRMTAAFPLLDAFKFGTRLRYPVAPIKIDVAAVPAYLPVHVPIGKPLLTMEPLSTVIALSRPVNWKFKIQGAGISVDGISKLLSSIHENDSLKFYPLQVSKDDQARSVTAMQTLLVTVPFVPLHTGMIRLPDINIAYFDPEYARLESIVITGSTIEVFNPVWLTIQKVLLGAFILIMVLGVIYYLYQRIKFSLRKRQSLFEISRAASADELRNAMMDFAGLPSSHITFQQWLSHMRQYYDVEESLQTLVRKVEGACYGKAASGIDMPALAHELAMLLRRMKFKRTGYYKLLAMRRFGSLE